MSTLPEVQTLMSNVHYRPALKKCQYDLMKYKTYLDQLGRDATDRNRESGTRIQGWARHEQSVAEV